MSAMRLIAEIERRARIRRAAGESDSFELEITTVGSTHCGPLVRLSPGENFVELGIDGGTVLIVLDQITSVRQIWL